MGFSPKKSVLITAFAYDPCLCTVVWLGKANSLTPSFLTYCLSPKIITDLLRRTMGILSSHPNVLVLITYLVVCGGQNKLWVRNWHRCPKIVCIIYIVMILDVSVYLLQNTVYSVLLGKHNGKCNIYSQRM